MSSDDLAHHGHEHHGHEHHGHEHAPDEETTPADITSWAASTPKLTCPACGATGAVSLGGGVFCPSCGETTVNPGYSAGPKPG